MTNEELNAIRQVIREELRPVKEKEDVTGLQQTVDEHGKKIDRLELNRHYTFEAVKDVAGDLREAKTELREVKAELRQAKTALKEAKEAIQRVDKRQEQMERRLLQNQVDVVTALPQTREIKHEMTRYDEIIAMLETRIGTPPSAG